ncbi:MAG: hypothetical protein BWY77_01411 [bacterium ADurb.Bin431]|nr:MAG: hypothetical protein BWY77_01411 [bacterium ADurb.Bin431]
MSGMSAIRPTPTRLSPAGARPFTPSARMAGSAVFPSRPRVPTMLSVSAMPAPPSLQPLASPVRVIWRRRISGWSLLSATAPLPGVWPMRGSTTPGLRERTSSSSSMTTACRSRATSAPCPSISPISSPIPSTTRSNRTSGISPANSSAWGRAFVSPRAGWRRASRVLSCRASFSSGSASAISARSMVTISPRCSIPCTRSRSYAVRSCSTSSPRRGGATVLRRRTPRSFTAWANSTR